MFNATLTFNVIMRQWYINVHCKSLNEPSLILLSTSMKLNFYSYCHVVKILNLPGGGKYKIYVVIL